MKKTIIYFYLLVIGISVFNTSCTNNAGSFVENTDTLGYTMKEVFAGDTLKTYSKITYPYFLDEDENTGINTFLLYHFTNENKLSSFKELADFFVKQQDSIEVDSFESTRNWAQEISINVEYQYYPIIALSNTWYEYTGGAHGNHGVTFINYNCKTHDIVELEDLFNLDQLNELTKIGEQIFRKNEGLKASDNYDNYFFEHGIFILPNNFSIRKDGLLFQYGIYEIKPYVDGTTELMIPYSAINSMITDNSLLRYIRK